MEERPGGPYDGLDGLDDLDYSQMTARGVAVGAAAGRGAGAYDQADVSRRPWPDRRDQVVDLPRPSRRSRIFRGTRSLIALMVIAIVLGIGMAVSLGYLIWLLAEAIHHAASS